MVARARMAGLLGCFLLAGCVTDTGGKDSNASGLWSGLKPAPETKGLVSAPGGILGGTFGVGLAEADHQRALAAEMSALESGGPGSPVGWTGEAGAHGTVIAGPAYSRPGFTLCRDFTHTVYLQGKPQISRGLACKVQAGDWTSVS